MKKYILYIDYWNSIESWFQYPILLVLIDNKFIIKPGSEIEFLQKDYYDRVNYWWIKVISNNNHLKFNTEVFMYE